MGRCGLLCVNAAPELPEFNHNPLEHFEMESRMSRYYDEWVSQSIRYEHNTYVMMHAIGGNHAMMSNPKQDMS